MTQISHVALLLGTAAALVAGCANAACPGDLPLQMLEDCIVVEGSGDSFPNPDYAYMKQYQEWRAAKASRIARPDDEANKGSRLVKK